jgi:A/G-specific adenine glycosylase
MPRRGEIGFARAGSNVMTSDMDPAFRRRLARWFAAEGRSLPWRDHPSPYAVLVSEFMLQQTTVATVTPRFEAWMRRFPDIASLAAAPERDVLDAWQGLGYYSRARRLHAAAKAIATRHHGSVPQNRTELSKLPGIGDYTAAAIAAFAFDQPAVVLDANIVRVVARLFDIRLEVGTAAGKAAIRTAAASMLPRRGGRAFTSALMDLGATICRAGQPDCHRCPVSDSCRAGNPAELPVKKARAATTTMTDHRLLAMQGDRVALVISPGPRWQGLWLLPPSPPSANPLASLTYPITRYRVHLSIHAGLAPLDASFFPVAALPPMPSPHRRALAQALEGIAIGRKRG